MTDLHFNGVTSVKFNPTNNAEVLTTGRDSVMRLIDVRKAGEELQSFTHSDFKIDLSYSGCSISPDGKFTDGGVEILGRLCFFVELKNYLMFYSS